MAPGRILNIHGTVLFTEEKVLYFTQMFLKVLKRLFWELKKRLLKCYGEKLLISPHYIR